MRTSLAALAAAGALFTLAPQAMASDFYVKEGSTGTGTSWANAFGTLEEAFAVAQSTDHILVHEGEYVPRDCGTGRNRTFCVPVTSMHGGFETSTNWDMPDGSWYQTVLSGEVDLATNTDNLYQVITVDNNGVGSSNRAIIDGFKITRGYANGTGTDGEGGGIRAFNSQLRLENLNIRDNFADSGGGLHFDGGTGATTAVLEWRLCRVRDNLAADTGGGGFLRNTDGSAIGNVKFRDCGGSVTSGGGLYLGPEVGDLDVTQTIFHDNSAGTGGAVYIENASANGSGGSVWTNNTVAFNSATGTGAGMYIEDQTGGASDPSVYNSIHYFNPEVANDENIILASSAGVTVGYSDIGASSTWTGTGNINADPKFRNKSSRNLRVISNGATAVISPCLDSGDDDRVPGDRLDIDDNTNISEPLPWDFDRFSDPDDPTQPSVRWVDVPNAPNSGNDTTLLPNNPAGVIVDMGAYEHIGIGDGGPGEG